MELNAFNGNEDSQLTNTSAFKPWEGISKWNWAHAYLYEQMAKCESRNKLMKFDVTQTHTHTHM